MDFMKLATVQGTEIDLNKVRENFTRYKKYLDGSNENQLLVMATTSWCLLHVVLEALEDNSMVDPTGFLYEEVSDLKDEIYLDVRIYLMKHWNLNVGMADETFRDVMKDAFREMFKRPMRELKPR